MERLRDVAVVFLLLVITGMVGRMTAVVTDERAFQTIGGMAFILGFALLLVFAIQQVITVTQEVRGELAERRTDRSDRDRRPTASADPPKRSIREEYYRGP
ncbi:MAG: hypothetical protein ACTIOA_07345 [Brachybacterium tyrofermentans]|uniref:hypothetical protein n=1 Tax=Brachybacterium tyrofermentans TaxID=47848 RepID=UPI003F8FE996